MNQWVLKPRLDTLTDSIVLMEGHRMMVSALKTRWSGTTGSTVIEWFKNDSLDYDVLYRTESYNSLLKITLGLQTRVE